MSAASPTNARRRPVARLFTARSPNLQALLGAMASVAALTILALVVAFIAAVVTWFNELALALVGLVYLLFVAMVCARRWNRYVDRSFAPWRFVVYADRIEVVWGRDEPPRYTVELDEIQHVAKRSGGQLLLRGTGREEVPNFTTSLVVGRLSAEDRFDTLLDLLEARGHLFSFAGQGDRVQWSRPWRIGEVVPGLGTASQATKTPKRFTVGDQEFPVEVLGGDEIRVTLPSGVIVARPQSCSIALDSGMALADVRVEEVGGLRETHRVRVVRFGSEDLPDAEFRVRTHSVIRCGDKECGRVDWGLYECGIELEESLPTPALLVLLLVCAYHGWGQGGSR